MNQFDPSRCGDCLSCLEVEMKGLSPFYVASTFGTSESLVCRQHVVKLPSKLTKSQMQLEKLHLIMVYGRSLLYEEEVRKLEVRQELELAADRLMEMEKYMADCTFCIICTKETQECKCHVN